MGHFAPAGELGFDTAARVHEEGMRAIRAAPAALRISLGKLTQVDSAGLAVLLDWLREAAARDCQLEFVELPESLRRLAAISEVDQLLQSSTASSKSSGNSSAGTSPSRT